jgi:ABC-type Fe3+-siderophore transport system permease subunit
VGIWLAVAAALLVIIGVSLSVGAQSLPISVTWSALFGDCHSVDCTIVLDARLPRTLAGLLAGTALGVAGAVMQTLTRNPLADPGILGVNAGASFAIVLGIAFFGAQSPLEYLFYAFTGALAAAVLVAVTGLATGARFSPLRLVLVGVALAAVLEGVGSGISLLDPQVFDRVRYWQAGSLDIRSTAQLQIAVLPVLLGIGLALGLARSLDSLGMGADLALALGTRVGRVQLLGLILIASLCGAATAVVGPVAFVGLMIPHLARWIAGPVHGRMLPFTLLLTPLLLLSADILGRLVASTDLRVSVMTALLGGPVLIFLARRLRTGASQ